ncbi:MAG TPA: TolC family protein [Candidatus Krumholzibacteria bacterium]|nr:TolC family protein [Candidatus Krumholzibacteria bacterium]
MNVDRLTGAALLVVAILATGAATGQEPAAAPADPMPAFTRSEPLGPEIDARPGAGATLDLAACIDAALGANDLLRAERLKRAELEGKMDQALSTGLPTLDLTGSWTRGRDPSMALDSTFGGGSGGLFPPAPAGSDPGFTQWVDDVNAGFSSIIPPPGEIPAQTFYNAGLAATWEINPVKILGAVGAARLGLNQQDRQLAAVEHTTVEAVMGAYYSIVRAAENVQAIRAQLANENELLSITRLRYDLGLATRLDTLQAAVTVANTAPQLAVAEARLRNEGGRLNALMGRRPEEPLRIANRQLLELDPLADAVALDLAQRRPELEATALFVDILRRNRQAQIAGRRPYLTLSGSYGYVGRTTDTVFDDGHDNWRATAAVTVPVFDGLLTKGLVDETDARIRRTEAELDGRRRDVQVEVLELLANLRLARDLLDAVQLNLERSEEVLDESLLMLQLGKTNYLDVLVAEANRAEARNNVIDARYTVLTLTASLKRAVGWSPVVPLSDIPGLVAEVER